MFSVFFTPGEVRDFAMANACDQEAFATYFQAMLEAGIYLPPSQFETCFLSGEHDDQAIEITLSAAKNAFAAVAKSR